MFDGVGEARATLRACDWAGSPLGPVETWPAALRVLVEVVLGARQPMFVVWGPERTLLYNEPYVDVLAGKHPAAGRDFLDVWHEIRGDLAPLVARAYAGEATHMDDVELVMERKGYPETTHWSYSYTPVRDDAGEVGGFLCACSEVTARVLAERRQRFLLSLEERLRALSEPRAVMDAAVEELGRHLGAERVGYSEARPDDVTIDLRSCYADGVLPVLGSAKLDDFGPESIARQRRGETQAVADVAGEPGQDPSVWQAIETRAFVSVPLVRDGRFRASLYVNRRDPHAWTDGEISLIESVASRTWSAVERARAEAALRENEGDLHFALDAGRFGTWRLDLATGEMTTSAICRTNFGRDPDLPFSYADLRAAVHPDDQGRMASAVETSIATGGLYDIEYRIVTPGGEERWVQIRGRPTGDADGVVSGMAGVSIDITARKAAEERQRASEARYRQIVEGAEDFAIVTLDAHGVITGWNTGAERLIGHAADEAIGRPGEIFLTPEDRVAGAADHEMDRAASDGRAVNERWHVRKDGTRFWGSGLMMPLAADDGGFVKIFRDRTVEHEAQSALRESEARLRFFDELDGRLFGVRSAEDAMRAATALLGTKLDASRCAYADVDSDNDRFWIRSDYSAPGIQSSAGTYSLDLFGPRAAADMRGGEVLVVRDVGRELGTGEGRETFQAIGIAAIVCCPLVKDGRLAAMMAVHQDRARDWTQAEIALVREVVERCWAHVERVGAEARLRESEERLRLAVEGADVGFWDVDLVNDVLIWPPRTKAMFGISADVPVTMQDFYDGLHPADRDATSAAFAASGDPDRRALYDVDYRTVGKEDGVVRWIAAKGRGVFDPAGRCVRVAGTAIEITARKEAEEALRDLNATLEARIAQALAEREEAQEALRQSQKMEAMGQLTGGVAHDFNNLLTPIVGALDMLQRKGLGGEREQRLIAGAAQSAERAKTLVQRLLAFARRQPLQAVPVDVAKIVSGMGELVASTTGPQIRVVVEAPEGLPPAIAEPNQLEMALLNLSVNARDAMPEGGTLRISASAESVRPGHRSKLSTGHYIRLSVADTGSGMDAATLARAVEPFFSTKGVGKGTGLGLSMVHGLASQLNGALTIQSRPGLGTNVELWLPRSKIVPADDMQSLVAADAPLARGTALLVDDEELVRASTADMLADLGYSVVEVSSGEEAMRLVDAGQPFDLLVTDHLMPGVSGTDLARVVRTSRPGAAILLVSGYAEREGLDPDLPRLTKPFRKDELAAVRRQII